MNPFKNTKIKTLSVSLFAIGLGIVSTSASGYATLFPARRWAVTPVAIDIDRSQAEASITDGDNGTAAILDALNDAVNGWNGAGSGDIVLGYETNLAAVLGDGFPTIEFNDPLNICTGSCLAATLTGYWHNAAGLEIIDDADIFVDAQTSFTSEAEDTQASCSNNEFFIEGILQHEVGHVIGLDHSTRRKATMYSVVSPCDRGADELANDDRNGANFLY